MSHIRKRSLGNPKDNGDVFLSCGASKGKVGSWLHENQARMYAEKDRSKGFDPFSYIDPDKYHLFENYEHSYNKYSKEAQHQHDKRQAALGEEDAEPLRKKKKVSVRGSTYGAGKIAHSYQILPNII